MWKIRRVWKNSDLAMSEKVEHADRSVRTDVVVEEIPLALTFVYIDDLPNLKQNFMLTRCSILLSMLK